ncbi:MAG TPA: CoA transferase [Solirubrobacter sp.]|nr:CoA transferase [Solirubrobacter sp.]
MTAPGPLAGVRVIELGMVLAGPFAGRLLADLGAEVIKVEAPDRLDPMREWGNGTHRGRTLWWPIISRNKKLVTLNLRERAGRELLLALVAVSDVLLESFRPGTLERWGLSVKTLEAANPGIVIARVSGYGQDGPYAQRPGFAAAAEAMSGLRHLNGAPGEPPPRLGISLGDSLAGMFAAQGVLAALYERDTHAGDRGQVVDVSILESCLALLESTIPEYDRLGVVRQPSGTRLDGIAPSNVFRTRDGVLLVIAANQDSLFRRLCGAMGRPELADDPAFATHRARGRNQDRIEAEIQAWAAERTAGEVEATLVAAEVVCAPVNTVADLVVDPHVRARRLLVEHHDPELGSIAAPGVVPRLSRTPGSVRWTGPWQPGAHNRDVYCDLLGRDEAELAGLRDAGVL